MSIKNKLNRLKPHLKTDAKPVEQLKKQEYKEIPYLTVWNKENVHPYWVDNDYCLIREVKYPLAYKHGKYSFRQCIDAVKEWNQSNFTHPLSANGHKANELFFFDTETTGLGGGAGNTIFILGYAQIMEEHVVLKQHILSYPGGEVPLFKSFLENVDYTTLVTYNGKAFDWPQVKTRHMFVKEHVPKLPEFGHFDLYHGARRMWKHRLERIKLSIVEEEVLDVIRQDDVPGFLAPMIYFDFVERKNPEGMLAILKHNELDILSLITLYTHLSCQLLQKDRHITPKETLEVGRWYSALGEVDAAKESLNRIKETNKEETLLAQSILAKHAKKEKKQAEAVSLWKNIIENNTEKTNDKIIIDAYIELAKVAEHQEKNVVQALEWTNNAYQLWLEQNENQKDNQQRQFIKRIERLNRKISNKKDSS
ncbi:ribonuclease H-like domain-containing protein [Niallia sp. 01092]|uniref:ribonuclease H-like domain-containing protein n=1 Tax=unclassified Niallia TaxID=2837522 RepID=UPI003FD06FB7